MLMAWVYILKGAKRHYLGSTVDLNARFAQHERGHTHTTTIGQKARTCRKQGVRDARGGAQCRKNVEEEEESKVRDLLFATLEQPRKHLGVGREFNSPPWHSPTLSVLKGRARDPFSGRELQP